MKGIEQAWREMVAVISLNVMRILFGRLSHCHCRFINFVSGQTFKRDTGLHGL